MGGFANQAGLGMMNLTGVYQQSEGTSGVGFWNSLLGSLGGLGVSSFGPDKDGWYDYYYTQPEPGVLCQFKEYDDGIPWVGYDDLPPDFSVGYLKWRLTGIARMKLEGWGL